MQPTGYLNDNAFLSSFKRDDSKYGTAYFVDGTVEDYWMVAPVDLPDGAVIENLSAYFIDKSTGASGENLTIRLIRRTINQNQIYWKIILLFEDVPIKSLNKSYLPVKIA